MLPHISVPSNLHSLPNLTMIPWPSPPTQFYHPLSTLHVLLFIELTLEDPGRRGGGRGGCGGREVSVQQPVLTFLLQAAGLAIRTLTGHMTEPKFPASVGPTLLPTGLPGSQSVLFETSCMSPAATCLLLRRELEQRPPRRNVTHFPSPARRPCLFSSLHLEF